MANSLQKKKHSTKTGPGAAPLCAGRERRVAKRSPTYTHAHFARCSMLIGRLLVRTTKSSPPLLALHRLLLAPASFMRYPDTPPPHCIPCHLIPTQFGSHGRLEAASSPVRGGGLSPAGWCSVGRRGQRGGCVCSRAQPPQRHALLPAELGYQPPPRSQVGFHSQSCGYYAI